MDDEVDSLMDRCKKGDFSDIEMWWREDRRHFPFALGVHELQNLHLDMTKIPLDKS